MTTYSKTEWVNNAAPPLNASNFNKMENQLYASDMGSNVKIVHAAEAFQDIIDSIPDASVSNPYTVILPPGLYTGKMIMKDYVSVQGCGIRSTILSHSLSPGDPGVIRLANMVSVNNMTVIATGENAGRCFVPQAKEITFWVNDVYTESSFDVFWSHSVFTGDYAFTGHFNNCHHKISYKHRPRWSHPDRSIE